MKLNYQYINKTLYIPESKILVIGDLHIGYDNALKQLGILIPQTLFKELKQDLEKLIKELKPKKIIFLGDITHQFKFEFKEKQEFKQILEFLETQVKPNNIIFIKGNHDTIDFTFGKLKHFHIEKDIIFTHGDKIYKQLFNKKIKTIIMSHIHPAVILSDKQNIKQEKYKAYLTGKYKYKDIIILPSFDNLDKGTALNADKYTYENDFSIIPKKTLQKFTIHIIGKGKVYDFGKVKDLE